LRRLIKDIHHHPRKALSSIESQFPGALGPSRAKTVWSINWPDATSGSPFLRPMRPRRSSINAGSWPKSLRSKMGEALTHVLAAKIAFTRGRYDRALEEYASAKVKAKGLTKLPLFQASVLPRIGGDLPRGGEHSPISGHPGAGLPTGRGEGQPIPSSFQPLFYHAVGRPPPAVKPKAQSTWKPWS
jgi:hypothetical protein